MQLPAKQKSLPPDPAKDRLTVSKDGIEGVGKAVEAAYRLTVLRYAFRLVLALIPVVATLMVGR